MSDRKILGFEPIYEPAKGSVVTHAFIICADCKTPISPCNGPRPDALCALCTVKLMPEPETELMDALDRALKKGYYIDIGMEDDQYIAVSNETDPPHVFEASSLRELGDLFIASERAATCHHTWVSMKNKVISSGEMCSKCGLLRR